VSLDWQATPALAVGGSLALTSGLVGEGAAKLTLLL
jgi:hypothetical protein